MKNYGVTEQEQSDSVTSLGGEFIKPSTTKVEGPLDARQDKTQDRRQNQNRIGVSNLRV